LKHRVQIGERGATTNIHRRLCSTRDGRDAEQRQTALERSTSERRRSLRSQNGHGARTTARQISAQQHHGTGARRRRETGRPSGVPDAALSRPE
jgi:hypothetical protein